MIKIIEETAKADSKFTHSQVKLSDGYILNQFRTEYADGNTHTTYEVELAKEDKYLPEILYRAEPQPHFEIRTYSCGSLLPDEIEKVIAGYKYAVSTVKELEFVLNMK